MPRLFRWALLCSPSWSHLSQPTIGQNGVVNRASQIPPTLAGGALARGAAFTIRGVHFGSAASVSIRQGNLTSTARVLAVEPEKIEAVMPDAVASGSASLVVTAQGAQSKPFSIEIAASNPGIFSQNKKGWGPGQIENIDSVGKRVLNSSVNPGHPGQRVAMRITGLGKGALAIVVIGNRRTNGTMGRKPSEPGEQEISFVIPADAPPGCFVPVYLQASATRASNVVTMAIRPGSGKCDSGPIPLLEANRMAIAVITRAKMRKDAIDTTTDEAIALFTARGDGPAFSPMLLLPPPGTCTAYTSSFQAATVLPDSVTAALVADLGGEGLAAGPQLTVSRDDDRRIIPWVRGAPGYYRGRLGSSRTRPRATTPLFLEPGKFTLAGAGGIDVGPFRVAMESPAPFEWTVHDETLIVERSRALPLHWSGQAKDRWTLLLATNVDQITTAIGTCLCTAPLNATDFEIPAALLANIPASVKMPGIPYDQLFIASLPANPSTIAAAGLGAGVAVTIYASGRFVLYH